MIDIEALKTVMETRGLTHAALAEKAGVSRPAITKLLNGRDEPRYSTIAGIIRALDLPAEDTFKIMFCGDSIAREQ